MRLFNKVFSPPRAGLPVAPVAGHPKMWGANFGIARHGALSVLTIICILFSRAVWAEGGELVPMPRSVVDYLGDDIRACQAGVDLIISGGGRQPVSFKREAAAWAYLDTCQNNGPYRMGLVRVVDKREDGE